MSSRCLLRSGARKDRECTPVAVCGRGTRFCEGRKNRRGRDVLNAIAASLQTMAREDDAERAALPPGITFAARHAQYRRATKAEPCAATARSCFERDGFLRARRRIIQTSAERVPATALFLPAPAGRDGNQTTLSPTGTPPPAPAALAPHNGVATRTKTARLPKNGPKSRQARRHAIAKDRLEAGDAEHVARNRRVYRRYLARRSAARPLLLSRACPRIPRFRARRSVPFPRPINGNEFRWTADAPRRSNLRASASLFFESAAADDRLEIVRLRRPVRNQAWPSSSCAFAASSGRHKISMSYCGRKGRSASSHTRCAKPFNTTESMPAFSKARAISRYASLTRSKRSTAPDSFRAIRARTASGSAPAARRANASVTWTRSVNSRSAFHCSASNLSRSGDGSPSNRSVAITARTIRGSVRELKNPASIRIAFAAAVRSQRFFRRTDRNRDTGRECPSWDDSRN